jgi:nitrogen-specific signal transduction histidine kinase
VHASGSGLVLAIASELAQRMGGSIAVESTPGETVFRLDLPSAEGPGRPDEPFSHEIEAADGKKGAHAPVV